MANLKIIQKKISTKHEGVFIKKLLTRMIKWLIKYFLLDIEKTT